jgi:hypothetical protein
MKMEMRKWALLLILAAAALAMGQGYKLARTPKLGDELKYRLYAEFELVGTTATMAALITEKVVALDINGNFTVESRQTEGKQKIGAQEQAMRDTSGEMAVYTARGEVVEIKSSDKAGLKGRLSRLNSIVAPDREIKVGDSWSHTYLGSPMSGGVGGKATYKALNLEKVGERDALVVQFEYKETTGALKAESTGKAWVDVATGELLKLDAQWKNVPYMSGVPVDLKVTLNRA